MKIGLDLDGVILDNSVQKRRFFLALAGLSLEPEVWTHLKN